MRSGPGIDFPIIGTFTNDRLTLLARNEAGDWVEVTLPNGSGWAYVPLIQPDSPVADLPVSSASRLSPPPVIARFRL